MSKQAKTWRPLGDLAPGLIFTTQDGVLALKSEYHYEHGPCKCILLGTGEYAHFADGDNTLVAAVEMPVATVETPQSTPAQSITLRLIRVEFESDNGLDPEILKMLEGLWAS